MSRKLTLFFDGYCPLCATEMQQLQDFDKLNYIELVDIQQEGFENTYPHVDKVQADKILHAQLSDGTMLYGLDANCKAWQLVGKKPWMQILRWPIIRTLSDLGYLVFAKYRYSISYLFTGKRRCSSCTVQSTEL